MLSSGYSQDSDRKIGIVWAQGRAYIHAVPDPERTRQLQEAVLLLTGIAVRDQTLGSVTHVDAEGGFHAAFGHAAGCNVTAHLQQGDVVILV